MPALISADLLGQHFYLFRAALEYTTLEHLLEIQRDSGDLWAHSEKSGSESCYCEVARWNHKAEKWQRYCGIKAMNFEFADAPYANDETKADRMAYLINTSGLAWEGRTPIVHRMPDWSGKE